MQYSGQRRQTVHEYPAAHEEHGGGAEHRQRFHQSWRQPEDEAAERLLGPLRLLEQMNASVIELDDGGHQSVDADRDQDGNRRQDHDLRTHG